MAVQTAIAVQTAMAVQMAMAAQTAIAAQMAMAVHTATAVQMALFRNKKQCKYVCCWNVCVQKT